MRTVGIFLSDIAEGRVPCGEIVDVEQDFSNHRRIMLKNNNRGILSF